MMRIIYSGGFMPDLAIDDDKDSRYWGWLMAKNPADGRWVSLANMSLQITNAVFECEPSDAEALKATIADLEARCAELKAALNDAIESIEDWAGYASEYFRQKHGLAEEVARLKALAEGGEHG